MRSARNDGPEALPGHRRLGTYSFAENGSRVHRRCLPPEQPGDDGPELSVSQTHEQGTDIHTYLEARMLATIGMLFAVGRIIWIIIVVIVVLVLLGMFARGR